MRNWKHIRLFQNLIILLLSISALLLLLQVASYEIGEDGSIPALFSRFSDVVIPQDGQEYSSVDLTSLSAPVNIMVTSDYGRCALLLPSHSSQQLSHAASLLKEGLGSASQASSVSDRSLRTAISGSGIFFDYLTSLPVSVTAGRLGVSFSDQHSARYYLLAVNSSGVVCLYHWEDPEHAVCYQTAISLQAFTETLGYYEPNNAFFAFENQAFDAIEPYTVLTASSLTVPKLSASLPQELSDLDGLLSKLEFTSYHQYTQSYDGSEVILESPRSLQIQKDGTLLYSGDQEVLSGPFRLYPEGDSPTGEDAALAALRLALTVLPDTEEQTYWLSGLAETSSGWSVSLDYLWNGVPVYFSDGSPALTVEIEGSAITAFSFRCRGYAAEEGATYHLLPLDLAAVIAQSSGGGTLTIGQIDFGADRVRPDWLIR